MEVNGVETKKGERGTEGKGELVRVKGKRERDRERRSEKEADIQT